MMLGRGLGLSLGARGRGAQPYADHEIIADLAGGVYRRGGVGYASLNAMPGFSYAGPGLVVTPGVGYIADVDQVLSVEHGTMDNDYLFYAVGTFPQPVGAAGGILGELSTGGFQRLFIFRDAPDGGMKVFAHDGAATFHIEPFGVVPASGQRVVVAVRRNSAANTYSYFIRVGAGGVVKAANSPALGYTPLTRMYIGGSPTPAETMRGTVAKIGVRRGPLNDAAAVAFVNAA